MWPFKKKKDVQYQVKFLGDMQRLTWEEGDTLVFFHPGYLSAQAVKALTQQLTELFNGTNRRKVVVLEEGIKMGVLNEYPKTYPEHPCKERKEIPVTLRGVRG